MDRLPAWVSELLEKGGEMSECLALWREHEKGVRDERAAEREMIKAKTEADLKLRELEIRELELKQGADMAASGHKESKGRVELPKFVEGQDIDVFLKSFEKLAVLHKWRTADWALKLVPQLTGKALEAYARISDAEISDYDKIKQAILKRYNLTASAYKDKFRHSKQLPGETFREFCVREQGFFKHWCESEQVENNFDKLSDLMLREQMLQSSSNDLKVWLKEREPKTVEELVTLAEAYQTAHRTSVMQPRTGQAFRTEGRKSIPRFDDKSDSQRGSDNRTCFLCQRKGHISKFCPLQNKQGKWSGHASQGNQMNGSDSRGKYSNSCSFIQSNGTEFLSGSLVDVPVKGEGVVEQGSVSGLQLVEGTVSGEKATVLRDTGSTAIFVARRFCRDTGENLGSKEICLADGTKRVCPQVKVDIETPYLTGKVLALVMDNPVADIIIGNKGQVYLPVTKVNAGGKKESTVSSEFDVCSGVETRSQVKVKQADSLRESNLEQEGKTETDDSGTETFCNNELLDISGPEHLQKEQQNDRSLNRIRTMVGETVDEGKSHFMIESDILYRVFVPEKGEHLKQLVVPQRYRLRVMQMAHDVPLAGHLGNRKTRARILRYFFWPGVFNDVTEFCRSCPQCQKGVSKGRVGIAPLVSIPNIDEPFKRIAIDFVGPLQRTERGNKYILVVCDYATRYPEAVALKSQEAEVVAEALMGIFSRVGVPQEILSDQGTNFMSGLMKELCRLLHVRKLNTTPYHPQANGLVERFNGTLKKMLKCYAQDEPKSWDKHLPYVLFAYREVPQESTGFSPFELLYGRYVRGPLAILRETWEGVSDGSQDSVLSYILEVRDRLSKFTDLSSDHMNEAKTNQKVYYDRKARNRNLEVGQKVLLLLPTSTNKLLAQWKGPYDVVERVSPVDYKVKIGRGGVKTYHINMLKPWFERSDFKEEREQAISCVEMICALTETEEESFPCTEVMANPLLVPSQTVKDVKLADTLSSEEAQKVREVIENYRDVFTDVPGRTDVMKHSVKLKSEQPVYQKPYPLPYALRDKVKKEVDEMLQAGIVEETNSPWASPIVLVGKKDGTLRFCVDFRRVNKQTVFDPKPMPKLDEILDKLRYAKYFSKIDLTKGYWQIPLDEKAKDISAFVTPFGHYRFVVMPFGMVNSGASFVRLMDQVLSEVEEFTESFIDDILIFSDEFEDHLFHIKGVLDALRSAKLTAKPMKCLMGATEIEYLAHMVGGGKIRPTSDKMDAISKLSPPKTKKEVKSILGTISFYRKFIPNFSDVAAPLTDLTSKKGPAKIHWTDIHQKAFDALKVSLGSNQVLWNPDFTKPYILQTDACDRGLGAVLLQDHPDGRHPIRYLSKKLLPREQVYAVVEKECLGIVWAVKTLHTYLYGSQFVIETDHSGLQWLQSMKSQNQRLLRWSLLLQEYDYEVKHIPGSQNKVADTLSRT